jgi:hypothetical protein
MRTAPLLLGFIILSSCIQELPVSIPESSNHLVVGSIIYPDKLILLNVSYVTPFIDSALAKPKILEISIKENGVVIDHPKGLGPEIYSSTYPKEGSTYELTVATDNEKVTGTTTIPEIIRITRADFRKSTMSTSDFDQLAEASIAWDDPVGSNYYELYLIGLGSFFQYGPLEDPVLQQECDLSFYPSSFVFSDKQFEGETYTMKLRYGWHTKLTVVLRNVSEEYYHFKKSWHRHVWLQNNSLNVDKILEDYNLFPLLFQGDPVPLFSNFNNGFGIFAGFNEDRRPLKQL